VNRTRSILVGTCLLLLLATFARAADEGWSLSKLNPFGQSTATKKKMPRVRKTEPSTWDKVSSGTKNALTKTNQTINPWAKKSTSSSKRTGTHQAANRPKSTEKKSMFDWFGKAEEPKQPKTVSEFISQPKPK
jgi:hypothetical protein